MSEPDRLRLLYAAPGLVLRPGGGPCEHFLSIARALARREDVELQLVIGAPPERIDLAAAGVPECSRLELLPVPSGAWAVTESLALGTDPRRYLEHRRQVRNLARRLRREAAPDAVVERMWGFGAVLGRILLHGGSTLVLEENGPPGKEHGPRIWTDLLRYAYLVASRLRTRWIYSQAHRLIVQTEGLRGRLMRQFGAEEERIDVVPNAVDADCLEAPCGEEVRQGTRRRLGIPAGTKVLVYCGSLDRHHLVGRVVRAFLDALEGGAVRGEVQFYVLGQGSDRRVIEDLLERRGSRAVELLGPRPRRELLDWLAAADLAVAPYAASSFSGGQFDFSPLKIREAMALDLPVAATAGTSSNLIEHGRNGFLVEDDAGWRALFESLPDRAALAALGRGGRALVSRWTYDEVAARYVEVVQEARGIEVMQPAAVAVRS